jgi:hypothetical protein
MKRYCKLLCAFIIGVMLLSASASSAHNTSSARSVFASHKFYASLAQADLNTETNSIEVSLRLFSDDLERVLARREGRAVHLDRTAAVAPLVLAYLRERFEFRTADGQTRELIWVGMETQVDVTWVYFEIRNISDLAGATLRNRVFFEQFDEQTNTVNIRHGERHTTLVFRNGDDFKTVFTR